MKNKKIVINTAVFLAVFTLLSIFVIAPVPDLLPPLVYLSATSTSINQGQTITITISASDANYPNTGVNTILVYENNNLIGSKNCGGTASCSLSISRTYANYGTYTITADVTDMAGNHNTAATTTPDYLTINVNAFPIAVINTNPTSGNAPLTVSFNGLNSYDPDGGSIISYLWDFGDGTTSTQASTTHAYTTPGSYTVTLTVTDNEGTTGTAQVVITVNQPNQRCNATISSPTNGAVFWLGSIVSFRGTVVDAEDGDITANARWTSSINGLLGLGGALDLNNLSIGNHTVDFMATDSGGLTCSNTVTILVSNNTAPTAIIQQPDQFNTSFACGEQINFSGTFIDPEQALGQNFTFTWVSNIDGLMSNSQNTLISNLTCGTNHTITFMVIDDRGASGVDSIDISIGPYINPLPSVAITSPTATDPPYNVACQQITFNATASDDKAIASYSWLWNGTVIYTEASNLTTSNFTLPASFFRLGNHTITVVVTDNEGASTNATALFSVKAHTPPLVTIVEPSLPQYTEFDLVNFSAAATPTDECTQTGFTWLWLDNGVQLSLFQNFSTDNLTIGNHTIRIFATDDYNATGSANTTIEILDVPNRAPSVTINGCLNSTNGAYLRDFAPITCYATASDPDGDSIVSWLWSLDGGIPVSGTNSFNISGLAAGTHNISLTVVDNGTPAQPNTTIFMFTVNANQAPVVNANIVGAPMQGTAFISECSQLNFSATATDPEGDSIASWLWTWLSTPINYSESFSRAASFFGVGNHTTVVYATDNWTSPAIGSNSVAFEVIAHASPTLAINSPPNNSQFGFGSNITFSATATQQDNCPVNFTWLWTDNGNAITGANSSSFATTNLSIGNHTIRAYITDSYGKTASASVNVEVLPLVNLPPTVSVNCPASVLEYTPFNCSANVNDPENDSIVSYVWEVIGAYGPNVTANASYSVPEILGNGTYTVRLTITTNTSQMAWNETNVTVLNNAPIVTLVANPTSGNEPLTVNFTCSVSAGNGPYNYSINYGDNTSATVGTGNFTSMGSSHVYQNGTYNAVCTVTDWDNDSGNSTQTINVNDLSPTAVIIGNSTLNEGQLGFWTGANSTTPLDPIVLYEWDFTNNGIFDAVGVNTNYTYPDNGIYTLVLRVTDSDGSQSTAFFTVTVNNVPPTMMSNGGPYSGNEGSTITFTAAAADQGNDTFTYQWDWYYDGTFTIDNSTTSQNITITWYDDIINRTIAVRAVDDDGGISNVSMTTLNVFNVNPTADAGGPYTCVQGNSVSVTGSATDPGTLDTFDYHWDFNNDGVYDDAVGQTALYNCAAPGTFTIGLLVIDDDGGNGTDATQVIVTPSAGQTIINSTIYGGFYPLNYTWEVVETNVSNGSTLINASVSGIPVTEIINSTLIYSDLTNVAPIINCTVIGTQTNRSGLSDTSCVNQYIDPSDIRQSNITGTTPIRNSHIWYSNVTYSQVYDSIIDYSNINNSIIRNSTIWNSTVFDSTLDRVYLNGSFVDNSILTNVNATNSNITNSNLSGFIIIDSNVNNNLATGGTVMLQNGTVICNGALYPSCNNTNLSSIDTTGPSIIFVAPTPANGAMINATNVTINASVTDSSGVSAARIEWNGANYTMSNSGQYWSRTMSGLVNGTTYTYKVWANDTLNNIAVSETRTLIINISAPSTQPSVTLSRNPSSGTVPLTVNFTANVLNFNPTIYYWDFENNGVMDANTSTNSIIKTFSTAGTYTIRVIVSNGTANITNTTTVTASNPSSGGGGGGTGGAGGGGLIYVPYVYTNYINFSEKNPQTLLIDPNKQIGFDCNNKTHTIMFTQVDEKHVEMSIYPDRIPVSLLKGGSVLINLDDDPKDDLSIILNDIIKNTTNITTADYGRVSYTINMTLKTLTCGLQKIPLAEAEKKTAVPAVQKIKEVVEETKQGVINVVGEVVEPESKARVPLFGGLLTGGIVIVGLASYIALRRRQPKLSI